jgi:hypothetical protein
MPDEKRRAADRRKKGIAFFVHKARQGQKNIPRERQKKRREHKRGLRIYTALQDGEKPRYAKQKRSQNLTPETDQFSAFKKQLPDQNRRDAKRAAYYNRNHLSPSRILIFQISYPNLRKTRRPPFRGPAFYPLKFII